MQVLGAFSRFEQCVLNMALINICDSESYVGQQIRRQNDSCLESTEQMERHLGLGLNQFTIYLPHPDQEYEDITLEEGLTKGYNIEVQPVKEQNNIVYHIPKGGHFVVVMKQSRVDADFVIAATGIFVRPLAILSLDVIIDPDQGEYQSLIIKHPIIRDYPSDWESKLRMFLQQEIRWDELPRLVGYVDRFFNPDYRLPSWHQCYLAGNGFLAI
jgi:hypothetical protein